jgi:hypothetical protein
VVWRLFPTTGQEFEFEAKHSDSRSRLNIVIESRASAAVSWPFFDGVEQSEQPEVELFESPEKKANKLISSATKHTTGANCCLSRGQLYHPHLSGATSSTSSLKFAFSPVKMAGHHCSLYNQLYRPTSFQEQTSSTLPLLFTVHCLFIVYLLPIHD